MRTAIAGPRAPACELHRPYTGDFVIPTSRWHHIPKMDGYVFTGMDIGVSDSLAYQEIAFCDADGKWRVVDVRHWGR